MSKTHQQLAEMFSNYEVYVRAQGESHSLAEMQSHKSMHGYNDETGEYDVVSGICTSDKMGETNFGGAGILSNIVFLKGREIEAIYDGVVIYPTEIVCEMTASEYESFLSFVNNN